MTGYFFNVQTGALIDNKNKNALFVKVSYGGHIRCLCEVALIIAPIHFRR
ncbi:MAG: hypothetical protein OJF59_000315 [Cytophagales bacterium]|nr:MAG: hypothetical protein OJF59_000315 [Cytophagales bacterium]